MAVSILDHFEKILVEFDRLITFNEIFVKRLAHLAVISPEMAIGCVVYCSAEIESPGVIRHVEGTRFSIGEPDGTVSERCLAFSRAMVAGAGGQCADSRRRSPGYAMRAPELSRL